MLHARDAKVPPITALKELLNVAPVAIAPMLAVTIAVTASATTAMSTAPRAPHFFFLGLGEASGVRSPRVSPGL